MLTVFRSLPPNSQIESTKKGTELLTVCSGIERDIGELQKVIDTIKTKPDKYRISTKIIAARQVTIDEFKSKIRGVRERNGTVGIDVICGKWSQAQPRVPNTLNTSLAQHKLQTQKVSLYVIPSTLE